MCNWCDLVSNSASQRYRLATAAPSNELLDSVVAAILYLSTIIYQIYWKWFEMLPDIKSCAFTADVEKQAQGVIES